MELHTLKGLAIELNPVRTEVYWDSFIHSAFEHRPIYLAATALGLCRVTFPHESFEYLQTEIRRRIPNAAFSQSADHLREYSNQLKGYLDGERMGFTFPIDLRGTPFQVSVWKALTNIPFGEARSYSDIARTIGKANAVRAVGTANGANPIPLVIPCHRVIGKNQTLTGFRGGLQMKETLLRLEGFDGFTVKGHERYSF